MSPCIPRALVRMTPARRAELTRARALADSLFLAHPKPSDEDVSAARARLNRAGGNGNWIGSRDKRRLKAWTLSAYGDGKRCPCIWCGRVLRLATLTLDRLIAGYNGGRYNKGNIAPACRFCNESRADKPYSPFACQACPIKRARAA